MLKVPAFRTVDGVTVYADDTLWHRFYPVADQPRVRLDADGQPVFLLVKYALSDEELARNPTLPRGGGYLNVDVVFELDDDAARGSARQPPGVGGHRVRASPVRQCRGKGLGAGHDGAAAGGLRHPDLHRRHRRHGRAAVPACW